MKNLLGYILPLLLLLSFSSTLFAKASNHNRLDRVMLKDLSRYWSKEEHSIGADSSSEKISNKVINYYKDPKDKKHLIAITSSHLKNGNDCHACGSYLSLFFFKKSSHKWKLEKSYIGAIELGEYGMAPKKDELTIKIAAEGKLALFYKTHSLAQGYEGDFLNIYDLNTPSIKRIFSSRLSMDNRAAMSDKVEIWNSSYHFDKEFKIIQEISGSVDKKPFSKTKIFAYDGDSYKEVK